MWRPSVVAIITARGGSKGLPRKNVLPVAGRPLIAWTIDAAQHSRRLGRVLVSTDDDEIAGVARQWGADVPFLRPAALAQDDTTHVAVVEHVLDWLARTGETPDYVIVLQPTSPLRTSDDIDAAIAIVDERRCEAVVSVAPAHPHPWLTKRIFEDGTIGPFMGISTSERRQDLPTPYVLNGAIYLITPDALRRYATFSPDGAVAYVMPPERSLDIDSAYEMQFADMLLRKDPDAPV